VSVTATLRSGLRRTAPQLDERLSRARWRLRNRSRSYSAEALDSDERRLVETMRRDGVVLSDTSSALGDSGLYGEAEAVARELYAKPRLTRGAEAGSKETFKTKLAEGRFDVAHPFARIALDPRVLAVANGYLGVRSTLRALELWLTEPTPGPAIQTQLWHRDADDLLNVKLFVYFSDVPRGAGPFTYAPGTHPLGHRRELPPHDSEFRSTNEQMAQVVPESEWLVCIGGPGSAVFTDTCGYHKQLKPETDERLMLVAHYVSGTPYVPRALELEGVQAETLSDDQHVAVFDRLPGA
jgi:hypothetical protein